MSLTYHEYETNSPIECPHCVWSGYSKDTRIELHGETVGELFCPECDKTIALVDIAWTHQGLIREAADNPEARYILAVQNRIAKTRLESVNELPVLKEHDRLEFIWYVYRENSGDPGIHSDYWSEVTLKDQTPVFKEMAYSCDGKNGRVEQIKKLLREKYGQRFVSLEISYEDYDCGCYFED